MSCRYDFNNFSEAGEHAAAPTAESKLRNRKKKFSFDTISNLLKLHCKYVGTQDFNKHNGFRNFFKQIHCHIGRQEGNAVKT